MRRLFGDLLPDPTLRRASKATFGHIFDAGPRIDLVRRWAGEGVDPELVDPGELRSVWSAPELDPSSAPLLQHVALILGDAGQEDASSSMSVATAGSQRFRPT